MQTTDLIILDDFCSIHKIETAFIYSLHESGLVTLTTVAQQTFVPIDELGQLEKLVRLHQDMDINIAGIEAIAHLLTRVQTMQEQIAALNNRLHLYEEF